VTEWLLLLLGIVLTLGTGVFVAAEFSLLTVDRSTVERAVAQGDARAKGVLEAHRTLSTQLSGAQVGITVTTLVVGFLVEPSVSRLLRTPLEAAGVPGDAVPAVSVGVGLVLATGVSMVVGELVPKNLAIALPLQTARAVAGPQRAFTSAAGPLIAVLNGSANRILRSMGVEPREELPSGRSPEELASLVRRSADLGTLDAGTAELITRSLDFGSRTASDAMTHRVHTVHLYRDDTAAEVVRTARRTGHSRFPVVGDGGLDDVVGVVHVKRAVSVPHERRTDVPVAALMADVLRVPETVRLDPLLLHLREQGLQMAVVVDEHGGTSGVVTLEDLVEEIVGEIADEHDRNRSGARRLRDGSWLVPGQLRTDEVRDRVGAQVPDGHVYETVGGFVMARLGRIPRTGDRVDLPGGTLQVERMDGRRVDRLRYVAAAPESAPGDEHPSAGPS
jgi:CBS domain containing-hemolysin-like protein